MGMVARRLHLGGVVKDAPKLSLPGKLVFPSMNHAGHFSMLGLGDIVSPPNFIHRSLYIRYLVLV